MRFDTDYFAKKLSSTCDLLTTEMEPVTFSNCIPGNVVSEVLLIGLLIMFRVCLSVCELYYVLGSWLTEMYQSVENTEPRVLVLCNLREVDCTEISVPIVHVYFALNPL